MTLGPKGRNVVIEQSFGAPKITKDGVTVAKAIEFKDKYHNLGAQLVRQVANKTNDVAGDGTTTSTVLCRAIYSEGCKAVAAGMNPMDLRRGINMAVDAVLADLKGRTKQIESKEEIRNVATISANSDVGVGELIANAMEKVRDEAPRPHSPISSRPSPPFAPPPFAPPPFAHLHSPLRSAPSPAPNLRSPPLPSLAAWLSTCALPHRQLLPCAPSSWLALAPVPLHQPLPCAPSARLSLGVPLSLARAACLGQVGKEGVITVQDGKTLEDELEVVEARRRRRRLP